MKVEPPLAPDPERWADIFREIAIAAGTDRAPVRSSGSPVCEASK
jgi:hypothetical protein